MFENIPKCPKCGSDMEKRKGKFGYFWGCTKFKTKMCKGTLDIPKVSFLHKYFEIDRENVPRHVKDLQIALSGENIVKGTIYRPDIEGKISGLIDYLRKNEMFFDMAKLLYWFYVIDFDSLFVIVDTSIISVDKRFFLELSYFSIVKIFVVSLYDYLLVCLHVNYIIV